LQGIFENEEERDRIMGLPELEREKYISERFTEIQRNSERAKIFSGQDLIKHHRNRKRSDSFNSDSSGSVKRAKRKRRDSDEEFEVFPTKVRKHAKREREVMPILPQRDTLTLEDIERIRLKRDLLIKWVPHLYFDKTVKGAFVRYSIGSNKSGKIIYIICEIEDVVEESEYYRIDQASQAKTNKYLILRHGKTKKKLKIDGVSNTPFTQEEFSSYLARLAKDGFKPITLEQVESKAADIAAAENYKYSAEEFEEIIQKQLDENLRRGTVGHDYLLQLEGLRFKSQEALQNYEDSQNPQFKQIYIKLEEKIKKIELALKAQSNDKNDLQETLIEKTKQKQQELVNFRIADRIKKLQQVHEEVKEEVAPAPVLTQYEIDSAARERLLKLHSKVLDIDMPDGPLKVQMTNYPPLLQPVGRTLDTERLETGTVISFEEWKLKY